MAAKLLRFLMHETEGARLRLTAASLVSGLSRGGLLAIVALAAASAAEGGEVGPLLVGFAVALAVYLVSARVSVMAGKELVARISQRLRLRLLMKFMRGPMRFVETTGIAELHNHIGEDVGRLSGAALTFTMGFQHVVLAVVALAYLGWLTPVGLLMIVLAVLAGAATYLWQDKAAVDSLERARDKNSEFFLAVNDLFRGFKELKQSHARQRDLADHLSLASDEHRALTLDADAQYVRSDLTSEAFMLVTVGALVFGLPWLIEEEEASTILQFLVAVLFVMGPVSSLVSSIPALSLAQRSLERVDRLEGAIDEELAKSELRDPAVHRSFREITLEEVSFRFEGAHPDESFSIGPLSLTLRRGERLFIIGGNGAGKTTLLKLLIGLYTPDSGRVLLDGEPIVPADFQAYRELFAVVFSNYHLFQRLYGVLAVEEREVVRVLTRLGIDTKTRLLNGAFSTQDLSGGQCKRLAYAVARLLDREVYVFDEFAADQDPQFRRFFYDDILDELRSEGKTVVAISHDDRYFDRADRVVELDWGQIVEVREPARQLRATGGPV
ncbi:MAG: cyclic peptide export ABC transporter [Myxococcales bacterium]|nr:cyclic peptide export ABC transporter [Myxococcales bacterium]